MSIALETAAAIHWAGRTSSRIEQLELNAELTHPINLRLARLEEQVSASRETLLHIERDLHAEEAAND